MPVQNFPYQVLIAQNPDGSFKGALRRLLQRVTDDEGDLITSKELKPEPLTASDLEAMFSPEAAEVIATISAMEAEIATLTAQAATLASEKAAALTAQSQATAALEEKTAALANEANALALVTGDLETAQEELAAAQAEITRLTSLIPPTAPGAVTQRQFRLALVSIGIMPSDITLALSAIEDEIAREQALIEWEYATSIERDHPLVLSLAEQLNKTSEEVDAIFETAAGL
jgi:DNA repair exonuclease SbcCD ATPase subunit